MKTGIQNLTLILSGLTILTVGLYRSFPPKINVGFLWNTLPTIVAFVMIVGMAIAVGGWKFLYAGIDGTMATASNFLIIIALLMPIIGFSVPLAHHFEHTIGEALRGPIGYVWGIAASFGVPGGNTLAGIISKLWQTQHHLRPLLLYIMTATPLISFTIFFIRKLGLGEEIALQMYKTNWIVAIGLAPMFWLFGKFICR